MNSNDIEPKKYQIKINGRERTVTQDTLSYDEVVALAFPDDQHSTFTYTVTYSGQHVPDGSLAEGQKPVQLHNGMKFYVTKTNRS